MQNDTKAVIHIEDDGSSNIDVKVEGTGFALIALLVSVMQEDEDFKIILKQAVFYQEKFENDLLNLPKRTKTFDA